VNNIIFIRYLFVSLMFRFLLYLSSLFMYQRGRLELNWIKIFECFLCEFPGCRDCSQSVLHQFGIRAPHHFCCPLGFSFIHFVPLPHLNQKNRKFKPKKPWTHALPASIPPPGPISLSLSLRHHPSTLLLQSTTTHPPPSAHYHRNIKLRNSNFCNCSFTNSSSIHHNPLKIKLPPDCPPNFVQKPPKQLSLIALKNASIDCSPSAKP